MDDQGDACLITHAPTQQDVITLNALLEKIVMAGGVGVKIVTGS